MDRRKRDYRIKCAQEDLESALFTLRDNFKVKWTDCCFQSLYYLLALVRKERRYHKMKMLLFVSSALALLVCNAAAHSYYSGKSSGYEIADNPDRRISFGFNFDHTKSGSDYSWSSRTIKDFTKSKSNSWLLDVKVPMSSMFTFGLRGGMFSGNTDSFASERLESSGYNIGFGVRWYVP